MKTESTYLTSGNDVLIVRKDLATAIGLNEAIILNQIHYWIQKNKDERHYKDGRYWMWETYDGWHNQMPFMSMSTIKRTMKSLKKEGLIEMQNFNKKNWDRTVWYSVNYEKIDERVDKIRECQNDTIESVNMNHSVVSKWSDQECQNDTTNTKEYSKNTTQNTTKTSSEGFKITDFAHMIDINRDVKKVLKRFAFEYRFTRGEEHPTVSRETLKQAVRIIDRCLTYVTVDDFQDMIKKYFDTGFNEGCDYRIMHFLSNGVLEKRMYELGYGQSVVEEIAI